VDLAHLVVLLSGEDVLSQLLGVDDEGSTKYDVFQVGSSEGLFELFLCEHWSKVLGIRFGEAGIPLFGIDVPSSSERVRFAAESTRSESNLHVEGRK
jgi:hypothetical protein